MKTCQYYNYKKKKSIFALFVHQARLRGHGHLGTDVITENFRRSFPLSCHALRYGMRGVSSIDVHDGNKTNDNIGGKKALRKLYN